MAMLKLHDEQLITLPPPQQHIPHQQRENRKPRQHTAAGDPCPPITQAAGQLRPIRLERVTKTSTHLWNELMDRYHYLGFTVLRGAQLRYLIHSSAGCVGAIGFASPAWKTYDRDTWIGWDQTTRANNLHYIVNNARFLLLPWVTSKNLASKVLSLCTKQVPDDWEERYGYRPVLLETFVEQQRFRGTCYKAANWIRVGQTTGRGKWEQKGEEAIRAPLPIKDIFVYPLQTDFRDVLCNTTTPPKAT